MFKNKNKFNHDMDHLNFLIEKRNTQQDKQSYYMEYLCY